MLQELRGHLPQCSTAGDATADRRGFCSMLTRRRQPACWAYLSAVSVTDNVVSGLVSNVIGHVWCVQETEMRSLTGSD